MWGISGHIQMRNITFCNPLANVNIEPLRSEHYHSIVLCDTLGKVEISTKMRTYILDMINVEYQCDLKGFQSFALKYGRTHLQVFSIHCLFGCC